MADNRHTHDIAQIETLQAALDAKIDKGSPGPPHALGEHLDVSLEQPAPGDQLEFDGTLWRNITPTEPPEPPIDPPIDPPTAVNPDNIVTVHSAMSCVDVPLQLGRPFVQGEITHYPVILVDNEPIVTQAHVGTRWTDGSVRTAVLCCHLPALSDDQTATLTFANQSEVPSKGRRTVRRLLREAPEVDATIELTKGDVTQIVSLREMVAAGHYQTIYAGPVSTSLVVADHSAAALYDIGFDGLYRPIRSVFHVQHWPRTGQTQVRAILELCNTTAQTNVLVDSLTITVGGLVIASRNGLDLQYGSRPSWVGWVGEPPPTLDVNPSLRYLVQTGLVPRWDVDRVIPEGSLDGRYSSWQAASRQMYDAGLWSKSMANGGGRHDLGLAPGWVVWWLYSGDARMFEIASVSATLAGAWPMHFREGQYGRARGFSRVEEHDAGGEILSINTRPTLFLWYGFDGSGQTTGADKITKVGHCDAKGWGPDCSHQPDPYTILYLLTGEFFYLEQAWFWAGWSAGYGSPANIYYANRGPAGWYGGLEFGGEPRTCAWPFRSRVAVAAYTPDTFGPQQRFFRTLVEDAITLWEGTHGVPSPQSDTELYRWGNQPTWMAKKWVGGIPNEFGYWTSANLTDSTGTIDYTVTSNVGSPWMHHFQMLALGYGVQLGFTRAQALFAWAARYQTGRIASNQISPFSVAAYRDPHRMKPTGAYFPDWAGIASGFYDSIDHEAIFHSQATDTTHGYAHIAMAAAAYAASEPEGDGLWAWVEEFGRTPDVLALLDKDPKWALVPRVVLDT